jgi:hypothetical protein
VRKRALVLNAAAVILAHNRHSRRNVLIRQGTAKEQSARYPQKYPHRSMLRTFTGIVARGPLPHLFHSLTRQSSLGAVTGHGKPAPKDPAYAAGAFAGRPALAFTPLDRVQFHSKQVQATDRAIYLGR